VLLDLMLTSLRVDMALLHVSEQFKSKRFEVIYTDACPSDRRSTDIGEPDLGVSMTSLDNVSKIAPMSRTHVLHSVVDARSSVNTEWVCRHRVQVVGEVRNWSGHWSGH
jgi:hypothetical protein